MKSRRIPPLTEVTEVPRGPGPRSGIALIDKPSGITSHQVVAQVRRLAGTRKVGHAGTLDPMATGLLVVGINRATRLLGRLALADKQYLGTIRLGITTLTDDAEGEVLAAHGAGSVARPDLERRLVDFRGDIQQVPSAVSAIKVAGVRSYARVRAGQSVSLPPRPVQITELELLDTRALMSNGTKVIDADIAVSCSSGTYIRALARDLGVALGTGGHLISLRRTRVGPFSVDQAQPIGSTSEGQHDDLRLLEVADVVRRSFPVRVVNPEQEQAIRHGRALPQAVLACRDPSAPLPAGEVAMMSSSGEFLALYRSADNEARASAVFVS